MLKNQYQNKIFFTFLVSNDMNILQLTFIIIIIIIVKKTHKTLEYINLLFLI